MSPEEKAEELVMGFLKIVLDLDKAKECAKYFIMQTIDESDFFLVDWWRKVFDKVDNFNFS